MAFRHEMQYVDYIRLVSEQFTNSRVVLVENKRAMESLLTTILPLTTEPGLSMSYRTMHVEHLLSNRMQFLCLSALKYRSDITSSGRLCGFYPYFGESCPPLLQSRESEDCFKKLHGMKNLSLPGLASKAAQCSPSMWRQTSGWKR